MADDSGYRVTPEELAKFAERLESLGRDITKNFGTYSVVDHTPDFGQVAGFAPAANLGARYANGANQHADARAEFGQWVQVVANAAVILSKNYSTSEQLLSAGAQDVKRALDQATSGPPLAPPAG